MRTLKDLEQGVGEANISFGVSMAKKPNYKVINCNQMGDNEIILSPKKRLPLQEISLKGH